MLIVAIVLFTAVALLGLKMAIDTFQATASSTKARLAHCGLALLGSVLVIIAALNGDHRLWINIVMAVVIIALGIWLGFKRSKGANPKGLVIVHGGLAAVCFVILAYYAITPL